jgi:hypothetical protein
MWWAVSTGSCNYTCHSVLTQDHNALRDLAVIGLQRNPVHTRGNGATAVITTIPNNAPTSARIGSVIELAHQPSGHVVNLDRLPRRWWRFEEAEVTLSVGTV